MSKVRFISPSNDVSVITFIDFTNILHFQNIYFTSQFYNERTTISDNYIKE